MLSNSFAVMVPFLITSLMMFVHATNLFLSSLTSSCLVSMSHPRTVFCSSSPASACRLQLVPGFHVLAWNRLVHMLWERACFYGKEGRAFASNCTICALNDDGSLNQVVNVHVPCPPCIHRDIYDEFSSFVEWDGIIHKPHLRHQVLAWGVDC